MPTIKFKRKTIDKIFKRIKSKSKCKKIPNIKIRTKIKINIKVQNNKLTRFLTKCTKNNKSKLVDFSLNSFLTKSQKLSSRIKSPEEKDSWKSIILWKLV